MLETSLGMGLCALYIDTSAVLHTYTYTFKALDTTSA